MTSRGVGGPMAWAIAAVLVVMTGTPALAEPLGERPAARLGARQGTTPPVSLPEALPAPRPRRVARAEVPTPPLCDGPGPSQIRRVLFNHAELEDPAAEPALQSAVQFCITAAPTRDRTSLRGPIWRG